MKGALPYIGMFLVVLVMNLLDLGDIVQRWMVALVVFVLLVGWISRRD